MRCVECGSQVVTQRPERTAHGYKRFRGRECGKQFNERTGTVLNQAQHPSEGPSQTGGNWCGDSRRGR